MRYRLHKVIPWLAGVLLALAICLVALRWKQRASKPEPLALSGTTMGGTWEVRLDRLPPGQSADVIQSNIESLLDRLDRQMSLWKQDSDLSRFNRSRTTDWQSAPVELVEVLTVAREVSEQTGGAFDVTVAPLVMLWGFGPQASGARPGRLPTDAEIAAAKAHVDYRVIKTRANPPAIRKTDVEAEIDLGGVAKGYAADMTGQYLQSIGAEDYLIAIGGELRAHGRPRKVGIETPTPDVRRIFRTIELRNQSLSTSGDYRNFFKVDGKSYCHEIDPKTGRPIERSAASVSVIHESGAYADAMATGLIVLGPQSGLELARRTRLKVIMIVRNDDRFETLECP